MLRIRLQRVGRKNIPVFRIVLTDSKNSTKSGKYLEVLGSFDPIKKTKTIEAERIKYWISKGAKPTDTLHNLLITEKVITGKKVNVLPRKSPIKPEVKEEKAEKPAEAKAEEKVAEEKPVEAKPEEIKA